MEATKLYHIKVKKQNGKQGVVTVATAVHTNRDKALEIAFAFCSPKDRFERKKGAKIAFGRMGVGKSYTVTFSGHSADDIVKLWNHPSGLMDEIKPQFFKDLHLANIEQGGLTFSEKI